MYTDKLVKNSTQQNNYLLVYVNNESVPNSSSNIGRLLLLDTVLNTIIGDYRVIGDKVNYGGIKETVISSPFYHVLTNPTEYTIHPMNISSKYFKIGSSIYDGYQGIGDRNMTQTGWLGFVYDVQFARFTELMEKYNKQENISSVPLMVVYV